MTQEPSYSNSKLTILEMLRSGTFAPPSSPSTPHVSLEMNPSEQGKTPAASAFIAIAPPQADNDDNVDIEAAVQSTMPGDGKETSSSAPTIVGVAHYLDSDEHPQDDSVAGSGSDCRSWIRNLLSSDLNGTPYRLTVFIFVCTSLLAFLAEFVCVFDITVTKEKGGWINSTGLTSKAWMVVVSQTGGFIGGVMVKSLMHTIQRYKRPRVLVFSIFWVLIIQGIAAVLPLQARIPVYLIAVLPKALITWIIDTVVEGRASTGVQMPSPYVVSLTNSLILAFPGIN